MKNKQGNIKIIVIFLAFAILVFFALIFGLFPASINYSCTWGTPWSLKSIDSNSLVLSLSNTGVGTYCLDKPLTFQLNKIDCERVGLIWSSIQEECRWNSVVLDNKEITQDVLCTHSLIRLPAGNFAYQSWSEKVDVSFNDGIIVIPNRQENQLDVTTCSGTIIVIPKSTTAPIPTTPQAHGFSFIINSILSWIKGLFTSLGLASIQGATAIQPNTQQTYQISINAAVPDSNYSDGTYSIQYANWALVDSSGNIIQQGTWEQINGAYTKSVTITTPSNPGNYVLLGVITQYDMTYNFQTSTWTSSAENIVNKEAINLQSKYVVIAPTNPTPGGFTAFILSIINWFKALFGI